MMANMNAATIIEPWMHGDPCEDCQGCERVCRKLQERIDKALAMGRVENERMRIVLAQYRDDLRHPPEPENVKRRLAMLDWVLNDA